MFDAIWTDLETASIMDLVWGAFLGITVYFCLASWYVMWEVMMEHEREEPGFPSILELVLKFLAFLLAPAIAFVVFLDAFITQVQGFWGRLYIRFVIYRYLRKVRRDIHTQMVSSEVNNKESDVPETKKVLTKMMWNIWLSPNTEITIHAPMKVEVPPLFYKKAEKS